MATLTADSAESEPFVQKAMQKPYLLGVARGAPLSILHAPMDDGYWNKPVFILSVLLEEMAKPPQQRLQWLLWVDQTVVISECCCRLSSSLPPWRNRAAGHLQKLRQTSQTHLFATEHWNGHKSRALLVHIDQWSIELFSDIVALRHYESHSRHLPTELSAIEQLLKEDKYKDGVQYIPQDLLNEC
jgi:hypothetical protein